MKTETNTKTAVLFDGANATIIEKCDTHEDALKVSRDNTLHRNGGEIPGVIFDFDQLEEAYKDARREDWGHTGGSNIYLFLAPKSGEVSASRYDKNSGPLQSHLIVLGSETYISGGDFGGFLSEYLRDVLGEDLTADYWTAVREALDDILDTDHEEVETRLEAAFDREDGCDGHGGTRSPEYVAESIKEWILGELSEVEFDHSAGDFEDILKEARVSEMSDPAIFLDVETGELSFGTKLYQPEDTIVYQDWEPTHDQPDEDATDEEVDEWAEAWAECFIDNPQDVSEALRDYWTEKLSK